MIGDGAPLSPGADQAREWAQHELSKPKYADHESWLDQGLNWLSNHVESLLNGAGHHGGLSLIVVVAAVILVLGVWLLARMRRAERTGTTGHEAVITDPRQNSEQLRDRAARAAANGDFDGATLDWFRAIARSGQERSILPADEHFTSHDVAAAFAAEPAPDQGEFNWAAALFDRVRYGHTHAREDEAERMRQVAEHASRRRRQPVGS